MTNKNKPYRLRLPGPTAVPERIRMALAKPVVAHRGPEFAEVMAETGQLIKPLLGTDNDVMAFTSSGTGMMEAAIANVMAPGDKALVLVNGHFGERFVQIIEALNLKADTLVAPWGEAVGADELAMKLRDDDYRAVIAVHNESSTGAVADLEKIGSVVRNSDALLVVDSVSGAGGLELQQDAWGVDVVVTASQKALMCPPGLGLASVSEKAWSIIEKGAGQARYCWDFRRAREAAAKGQTAFTSPMPLIYGLRESLRMIHAEGWTNTLERHRKLSSALRAGVGALGLPTFTKCPMLSSTVCVFEVPDGLDGSAIVRHLYETRGTVIAGSRSKLKGKVIRVGTMGCITDEDIRLDLEQLEGALSDLGWAVEAA
ncbi:pyridoxal-phosphate-dependent aminotransferase family protein [Pelagibius sp.]|uniref:pyridoxal-phosphate-dependent aminotransferase family protein n=1 Tax=Pelagibius sp. TaxID=1931238 RepID=UPI003BAF40CB